MASSGPSLGTLGEALIAIRADLNSLRNDMGGAKKIVQSGVDDISKSTAALGKGISLAIGAPIAALGAAMFTVGKKMDDVMDNIRARTGATGDELQKLGDTFRTVFKNVPNDAEEVSEAIIQLNKRLDISGPALETLATQFINLARVGQTEVVPLVTEATRLFGAWGVATEDQSAALDTLFKVSQSTGEKVGDLVATLAESAPTFKQFGFNLETSAAMLGQWQKMGINAEGVVGALRMALRSFAKDGVDAKEGLKNIIDQMKQMGPGAAQSGLALATFGRQSIAMTDAINRGGFSVDELVKKIRDSQETINRAAFDTLSFADKWKVLQHQVELAIEPLGEKLLSVLEDMMPLVTKTTEGVGHMADAFRKLPDSVQESVFAVGALLALLGPALYTFGKASEATTALATGFFGLAKSVIALTGAMSVSGGIKSFGDARAAIQLAGEAAGITASKLGVLGTAGAIAAAAFVGWEIGKVIGDLTGATAAIERWASAAGRAKLIAEEAGAKQDVLDRATKNAGHTITDFSEAQRINAKAAADQAKAWMGGADSVKNLGNSAGAAYDPMVSFQEQLGRARDAVNNLSEAKKQQAIADLAAGAAAKDVQKSLGLNDLAMGLFSKTADEAKTKMEALKKSNLEYAESSDYVENATHSVSAAIEYYDKLLEKVGNDTYEGIVADKQRGIGVAAMAAHYKVSEQVVNAVIKSEEQFKSAIEETTDAMKENKDETVDAATAIGKAFMGMPSILKDLSMSTAVFKEVSDGAGNMVQALVSGSLLSSHALAGVAQQGALIGTVEDEVQKKVTAANQAMGRSFLALTETQKAQIDALNDAGVSAAEIASTVGVSIDQVTARTATWTDSLGLLVDTFVKLGQAAGGSLGEILSGVGQIVVSLQAAERLTAQIGTNGQKLGGNFGAASVLFSSRATNQQKIGAGIAAGAAIGQGVMDIDEATSSHRTTAGNALGGAMAGAKAGAAFGPYGVAIGAAAGLVIGLIRGKPDWAKAADEVGRDFGAKISDGLAQEIDKTAKSDFGGNRLAAQLVNMDKIISEAGGLNEKNINQMTRRMHDVFSLVQTGTISAAKGVEILDKNFGTFVTASTSGVGVLNSRITELIKINRQMGLQSAEMAKYVKEQVSTNVFGGLATGLGISADALRSYDTLNQKQMDLRAEMAKTTDSKTLEGLQEQLDETMTELNKVGPLFDATKIKSQATANAMVGAILAGVYELQNQGVAFVDAIAQAAPAIEALGEQLKATGFEGGAAFSSLQYYVALAKDEIAGPALQAAAGFGQALVGLNNSGLLTADMFAGIASQISSTRDALVAAGKDGGAVLRVLAPQLQQIWEIQKQTGMAVDESTQALLDEAEAAGLVGEKFQGPQQKMIDALTETNDILSAIATSMGVALPQAAAKGAAGVTAALNKIPRSVDVEVNGIWNPPDENPFGGGPPSGAELPPEAHGFSGGRVISSGLQYFDTSGIVKPGIQYFDRSGIVMPRGRGKDTVPIMAAPGELLLNIAHQGNLAAAVQKLTAPQEGGGAPVELTLNVDLIVGDKSLGTFTERVTWPQLMAIWKTNQGGAKTAAKAILEVK